MMDNSNLPKGISQQLNTVIGWLAAVLLISITFSTVIAIIQEFYAIFAQGRVALSDILLMFIYLEILAMVHQYVSFGKIPVRYPIYITIIAIARYIMLGMKDMDSTHIVWLSGAIFVLTISTTVMRIGHHHWPYNKMPEN